MGDRLRGLSPDSLQWALGLFCAFNGAFLLVAPHQFASLAYAGLDIYVPGWGLTALAAGIALLAVPSVRPGREVTWAMHAAAALTLLLLAAGFAANRIWTGAVVYLVLGAATALAGGLSGPARRPPGDAEGDLFALSMGLAGALAGLLLLAAPGLFASPYYESRRHLLPALGACWLAAGLLLALVQVRPARRGVRAAIHLFAGGVFVAFGLLVSAPGRAWTGVALYCGGGAAIALLPWLRRRLAGIDPSALRTRLALALALATSIALIVAVAVVTAQEERLAAEQVVQMQRVEAGAIAQNVADYLDYNGARTAAVAATAGLAPLTPEDQAPFLERTAQVHPDVAGFATLGPDGEALAITSGYPLGERLTRGLAAEALQRQFLSLRITEARGRRLLMLTAPILQPGGEVAGALVAVLDSASLARRIVRPGSRVYLADGQGQTIAVLDRSPRPDALGGAEEESRELPPGWDREVAADQTPLVEKRLIAFAPVPGIGWAVAVERPRAAALAGVRQGRDLAFLLLIVVVGLAVLAGIVTARRIARPLGTLADAVDQLAAGNPRAPLEASSVTEVARLSAAFTELRDRLAERTDESERLAAELRARAEALAESDRRKDEFLAMLAHELRNPLGAIANASYVIDQLKPDDSAMTRSVAVIQRQIQHLVRMVDDLLDVSRITRGKIELKREPLDLIEVVRHTVENNRLVVDSRQHQIAVELPPGPLPLIADATRLDQVLSNLIRNAVKFTDPGGHIEVAVRRDGDRATVAVRDDGIGIGPELLPRIFDLFTQGERALDRSGAGLGIGLTLVRRLVELHGGRVEARSEGRGHGAEFLVHLPLAEQPAGPREEHPRGSALAPS